MAASTENRGLPISHNTLGPGCVILALLVLSNSPGALAGVGLYGDFNADGLLGPDDADLLTAEIAAGGFDLTFDLNGDMVVSAQDLDGWFPFYSAQSGVPLAIALVDVNFDRTNTVADYQVIQSNVAVKTTRFTDGNLNADSLVDDRDLLLYISRGGVLPEPATLGLLALGGLAVMRRWRRQHPVR